MIAGYTRQKFPFILAGCSLEAQLPRQVFAAGALLRSLHIPGACPPVQLDLLLVEVLQLLAGTCIVAGATIYVPGTPGVSGGVLGDPASSPQSAGGLIEILRPPWSLVAFPGGPGMAQNIELPVIPAAVQAICAANVPDHRTLQRLSAYTYAAGGGKFIALTDGSGPGACGAALIRNNRQAVLWRLEEVRGK